MLITARKRSLGQGNIFAPVCHSVHRVVCPIACWDTPPPRPEAGTPPKQTPLGADIPLGADPQCSACWEMWATSGRYASYWNAILFGKRFDCKIVVLGFVVKFVCKFPKPKGIKSSFFHVQ